MADAFHHAAVAQEGVGEVIHHLVPGPVEFGRQQLLGQCHAHGIRDALAQRSGGGFHARCHTELRVPRRLAVQLAELLQVFHRQVVAGQMQQRIQQHGAVAIGQHEAVAVRPMRVQRVVLQVPVPQHFGHVGHAHGRTGVAGLGQFDRIDGQHADRVRHATREFRRGMVHECLKTLIN